MKGSKRMRVEGAAAPAAALAPTHASPEARAAYASAFASGSPFPHLHVRNIFSRDLAERVRAELLSDDGEWVPKRNDLYAFSQRNLSTLSPASAPATHALVASLYSPAFRAWISSVSGVDGLDATVDCSAARYAVGDRLLCHDDDLATRRVAYILYFTPDSWDARTDGGSLQLFDAHVGGCGQPGRIVAEIAPLFNSLAFFTVGPTSFHSVGEVLSHDKGPRISISGWFHGVPLPDRARPPPLFLRPIPFVEPRVAVVGGEDAGAGAACGGGKQGKDEDEGAVVVAGHAVPVHWGDGGAEAEGGEGEGLVDWVNPLYLKRSTQASAAEQFSSAGSLQLSSFLREDKYDAVIRALSTQRWVGVGPPIAQSFRIAHESGGNDTAALLYESCAGCAALGGATAPAALAQVGGITPDPVARLFRVMMGAPFRFLIARLTGHGVVGEARGEGEESLGAVRGRVRAFGHGDYCLVVDPGYLARAKAAKAPVAGGDVGGAAAVASTASPPPPMAAGALVEGGEEEEDLSTGEYVLDITLNCVQSADAWEDSAGGSGHYLTSTDELLTLNPSSNTLALVAQAPQVLSYVEYVTHAAGEARFDVSLQYRVE